ncbi:MAG: MATE family efflux transporter [Candidatus Zixiibacteriota bacterium]
MAKVKNITDGPILSTILSLAWPVVTGMALEFALNITDYFWVGFLGTPEQDAITSSMIVTWTLFAVSAIIVTGLTAIISRSIGAKKPDDASYYARQGIIMAISVGLIAGMVGFIFTPDVLTFMKASPQVVELGIPYLRIFFIAILILFINDSMGSIFRASGDTKSPTIAFATGTVLNLFLDPLFIFGWGPFPAMGVAGAALATSISVLVAMLVFITLILKGRLDFSLAGLHRTKPHLASMLKIAKIGLPISMQNIVFVVVYWFIIQIVHQYGDNAGAAMGIGNRMEALSYLTTFGFSMAASTMVGQNLGAGKPDRAARCAWGSVGIVVAITFVVTVIFVTIPKVIAGIFSSDPATVAIAADYLFILGLSQVFMGVEITLEGAFSGSGNTLPPMSVSIPGSIARLPLAYLLCFTFGAGINGVWWTLTITSFAKAIVLALWFKKGNWKKKKL